MKVGSAHRDLTIVLNGSENHSVVQKTSSLSFQTKMQRSLNPSLINEDEEVDMRGPALPELMDDDELLFVGIIDNVVKPKDDISPAVTAYHLSKDNQFEVCIPDIHSTYNFWIRSDLLSNG